MFKLDDRIRTLEEEKFIPKGSLGTIVEIGKADLGVEFDFEVESEGLVMGHSCSNKCEYGHGWYVDKNKVEVLDSSELFDPVAKPKHYADKNIEVIDYIQDTLTPEQYEGYVIGNVIKYISRYQKKGGVQDLQKANYYLMEAICEIKER